MAGSLGGVESALASTPRCEALDEEQFGDIFRCWLHDPRGISVGSGEALYVGYYVEDERDHTF